MTAAAPTTTTSTARGIVLSVLVATVVASVVNTVISLISQALGADASVFLGLQPAPYIIFTLVSTLVAAIVWLIIRARASDPAAVLKWLVPVVVVVSLIPNVLVGFSVGWGGAGLMLMHVVVAVCAVAAYRRFLPLDR